MKRTLFAVLCGIIAGCFFLSVDAEAQQGRRRPLAEVVAWAANASIVVLAERHRQSRQRMDLVARRIPSGDVVARVGIFPGQCARRIEGQVAIAHACALTELRPRLPRSLRNIRYHVAAQERGRIATLTLRADGSIVEHELPQLGLVIRGRTEEGRQERSFAVLEVSRLNGSDEGRVLDRRPVRPQARRRWTLLQAGESHYIIVGRGVLRRIGRSQSPSDSRSSPPPSGLARSRPNG